MVRSFGISARQRMRMIDPVLLICTLILTTMSLLTLGGGLGKMMDFSSSAFAVQVVSVILGIIMMIIITVADYEEFIDKFGTIFYIISIGMLAITLVYGMSAGTNKSYLRIGPVGIQPSEFVKAAYIMTFSKHLAFVKDKINNIKSLLGLALHAGVIIGFILISGDLGVALVYMGFTLIMLFCAGLSGWLFVAAGAVALVGFPYIWPHLHSYQQQRILVGFNPELDPLDKGLQPLLSRQAVANGGMWGQGVEGGSYYERLFASHTDFIFASFCEKFGFVGGMIMILTLTVMVVRILMIARQARSLIGSYICIGAAAIIIIQTLENVGMCMAILPVVGITLPFMSYGGSSMLSMYMIIGLVQSVRAHRGKYFFEMDKE
ncbi:MAG: FtsW/RodA/SpoVE family cell cycle protein [Clostridia bacterium]|nr:FtsW/RodA/SpoVE family cell cycle protein [Clostridia bacterium]